MPAPVPEQLSKTIETLYRSESGRVLATLVRLLGDLNLAEEAMHEAFAAGLEAGAQTGIREMPRHRATTPWIRRCTARRSYGPRATPSGPSRCARGRSSRSFGRAKVPSRCRPV